MAVAPLDPVLAENHREPDDDDFDTVLYSEPEQIAIDEPSLEDSDDQLVADADAYQTDFEDETAPTLTKVARWVQAATPTMPQWVSGHKSA